MSTNQVSKSQLGKLHKAHSSIWSRSNDARIIIVLFLCGFLPGSILYSQFNEEKVRLFPFFASGSTETRFWTTKNIKIVVLAQDL